MSAEESLSRLTRYESLFELLVLQPYHGIQHGVQVASFPLPLHPFLFYMTFQMMLCLYVSKIIEEYCTIPAINLVSILMLIGIDLV